jgi:hypothetical protein
LTLRPLDGGIGHLRNLPATRLSDPHYWVGTIFAAKAAGDVVRRSISWVDREIGRDRFFEEVRAPGLSPADDAQPVHRCLQPRSGGDDLLEADFRR